jgi:hypothetical protein
MEPPIVGYEVRIIRVYDDGGSGEFDERYCKQCVEDDNVLADLSTLGRSPIYFHEPAYSIGCDNCGDLILEGGYEVD